MLEYKGYAAGPLEIHPERGVITGTVAGLKGAIRFEGANAKEIDRAFRASIDGYLTFCASRGEKPDKPFGGKILVRTTPELHRKAAVRSAAEGMSLSAWISRLIDAA